MKKHNKPSLPFHITISHNNKVVVDCDSDGFLIAVSKDINGEGGVQTFMRTNCDNISFLGICRGAKRAIKIIEEELREKKTDRGIAYENT